MKIKHRLVPVLLAGAAAVGLSLSTTGVAQAATAPVYRGSSFNSVLHSNEYIRSPNGQFQLIMQTDGNLVLYRLSTHHACWASSWYLGGYRPGDYALFSTIPIKLGPGDVEYGLAVGHYFGPSFVSTFNWDDGDFSLVGKSYNVNVNDKGQLWIADDEAGWC
jgi:hypothetical protein